MARVALDAMGGDRAPDEIVAGGVLAASQGHEVVLVGDEPAVSTILKKHEVELPVVHAGEVIHMGEDPARSIREKPDASIVVAARLVAAGEAEGLVSAGSTGAALAAAAILVGRIPGVHRPAIASIFPTPGSPTVVLDCGANPDCKPEHLVQFGVMGAVVSEVYFDLPRPRVGLLNIGEERSKGRDLERAAFALLEQAPLEFVGNVEGRDLAADRADVFVTDGFTGNVFLKTTEGTAQFVAGVVMEALSQLPQDQLTDALPLLGEVKHRLDYESFGGAHLVGVRGVVVISHGSSSRVAISNAVAMADDGADRDLVGRLASRLGPP